ncbi:MAG: FUSC family protein [Verrucomicrobiota bacterium]
MAISLRKRGWLFSRISHWSGILTDIDPGGLKLAQAIKTACAVVVSGFLCHAFATQIPTLTLPDFAKDFPWFSSAFESAKAAKGLPTSLTILGAAITLNFFLLIPGAGWALEFRRMCMAVALSFAILLPVAWIGPAEFGYGDKPMAILWVALIGIGLYLRRWGQIAGNYGLLIILVGLFAMILNPTKAEGFWFAPTILIASLVTFAFRFLTLRPSAINAFRIRARRFLGSANEALETLTREDLTQYADDHPELAKAINTNLRHYWHAVQLSLEQATLENPSIDSRLRAQVVALYRMIMALEVITDSFLRLSASERKVWSADERLSGALKKIRDNLSHPVAIGFPSEAVADPKLESLLDDLLTDQNTTAGQKLQPARIIVGLRRLEKALYDYFQGRSEIESATIPSDNRKIKAEIKRDASRGASRLALQGLIAAAITTGLQFIFALDHAYWATLTVALVLNATVGQTLRRMGRRVLGTAIGVAVAIGLVYLTGDASAPKFIVIFVALVVTFLTVQTHYGIASAGIGLMVTLLIHVGMGASIASMSARAYETFIGAGVALVVALLIVPSYSSDLVRKRLIDFLKDAAEAIKHITGKNDGQSTFSVPLATRLQAILNEAPAIAAEHLSGSEHRRVVSETLSLLDVLVSYIGLFEAGLQLLDLESLPETAKNTLKDLDKRINDAFSQVVARLEHPSPTPSTEDLSIVFPLGQDHMAQAVEGTQTIATKDSLVIIAHVFYGNRIGRALNDLVPVTARIK